MIIAKRLVGKAISAWLGPTGDAARRALSRAKETLTSAPRQLDVYIDVADPWSYLAAQVVDRLVAAYGLPFAVHVVTPPAADVDPAPVLRTRHAVRDAQQLAELYDLAFPGKKEADPGMVRDVSSALVRNRPPAEQLRAVLDLGDALWRNDKKQLVERLGSWGTESHGSILPAFHTTYAELRKAGHYQGAMIAYAGEWYQAVDRLSALEAAIARDLGREPAHVVVQRPLAERGPLALSDKPLSCELWFSFRSPYSYLALEQIETLLAPYNVPLVLRQVQPLVTRGGPLPPVKTRFIVRDAKREADRLGIAFGEICDPLGAGVDHCLAIQHWANQRGAGLAFARSAMQGIWAEARDPAEYVDLRALVERAGLPWDEARAVLGDPAAAKVALTNASDMAVISLWGVPAFRCGDLVGWGQDRLPVLADRLRRHALAPAPATPPHTP